MIKSVVTASIQMNGCAYSGSEASGLRVAMPAWIQSTTRTPHPAKRCVASKVLWKRTRKRGMAVAQTKRMANKAAYAVTTLIYSVGLILPSLIKSTARTVFRPTNMQYHSNADTAHPICTPP